MRTIIALVPFIILCVLSGQCFADDKAQVIEVETAILKIDQPVQTLNKEIIAKLEKLCPNVSDWACLKKHNKLFAGLYDKAYETNLKAVNKCYDLTQSVKRKSMSPVPKQQLVKVIDALSLKYSSLENASGYAQEAFEQLGANNLKGYADNMDQYAALSRNVKAKHAEAMSVLSDLKANMGISSAQK